MKKLEVTYLCLRRKNVYDKGTTELFLKNKKDSLFFYNFRETDVI